MLCKPLLSVQDAAAAFSLPARCKPWTHTHVQYERRYSHTCKHTYRPCLYPVLDLLSSSYCDVLYLLNGRNPPCWHVYKPVPHYAAVHSQCVCPFKVIFRWNPSITASPPAHLFTCINFQRALKKEKTAAAGGFNKLGAQIIWLND